LISIALQSLERNFSSQNVLDWYFVHSHQKNPPFKMETDQEFVQNVQVEWQKSAIRKKSNIWSELLLVVFDLCLARKSFHCCEWNGRESESLCNKFITQNLCKKRICWICSELRVCSEWNQNHSITKKNERVTICENETLETVLSPHKTEQTGMKWGTCTIW
jgi:hypothetical protein